METQPQQTDATAAEVVPEVPEIIDIDPEGPHDAGAEIEVTWRAHVNDFTGLDELYQLEVTQQGSDEPVDRSADYSCATNDPLSSTDTFTCSGTAQLGPNEGVYNLVVRTTVGAGLLGAQAPDLCPTANQVTGDGAPACDSTTLAVDDTPPETLVKAPATPFPDWFNAEQTVALECVDSASGCAETTYRIDGGGTTHYEGPFTLGEGEHTLTFQSEDQAGNVEAEKSVTLNIDTRAPSGTLTVEDPQGENGWHTAQPGVDASCEDPPFASGCLTPDPSPSAPFSDGVHTITYTPEDVAGNTGDTLEETVKVDTNDPVIETFGPVEDGNLLDAGATISTIQPDVELTASDGSGSGVTVREVWAVNKSTGEETAHVEVPDGQDAVPVDVSSIVAEPFDNVFRGDVTFKALVEDAAGLTNTAELGTFEIDTAALPVTSVQLANDPATQLPNGESVTLSYQAEWIGGDCFGDAVAGETIELVADDGTVIAQGTTDLSGLVEFQVSDADNLTSLTAELGEVTCAKDDPDDDDDGIAAPSSSNAITLRWTDIRIERLASADEPRTTQNATLEEVYKPAFEVTFTEDASPVEDARVVLEDGDGNQFSALTGEDGIAKVPAEYGTPSEVTFTETVTFDPADGPKKTNATDDDATVRWVEVQFQDLGPDSRTWNTVTDTVTFEFQAVFDFGAGTEPADGGVVDLVLTDELSTDVPTNATGHGSVDITANSVTDLEPRLEPASFPELGDTIVDAKDGDIIVDDVDDTEYARQTWTEIDLVTTDDDENFAEKGETVTFSQAEPVIWAHDEDNNGAVDDPVASGTLEINDDSGTNVVDSPPCEIVTGAFSCEVTLDRIYDAGQTLEVTSTGQDVVRQTDGEPATNDQIWTRISLSGLSTDDSFVNVDDTVSLSASAAWEHTLDEDEPLNVSSATLGEGDEFPSTACNLDDGTIADGQLSASVTCSEVVDDLVNLTVSSAANGVEATDVPIQDDITWTEIDVSYVMTDEDGAEILAEDVTGGSVKVLDHNDPVRFDAEMSFAHNQGDDDGASAPDKTRFAFFVEETGEDGETFNCVTDEGANSCVTEVTKDSGDSTFTVRAASIAPGDDGLFEEDITRNGAVSPAEEVSFRWTSIGFLEFECIGSATGGADCQDTNWQAGEIVNVTVTAVAEDTADSDTPEILDGATITIQGEEFTTNAAGQASKDFWRFTEGDTTVTARGVSATIDGQTVDWDTPRSETLHWE